MAVHPVAWAASTGLCSPAKVSKTDPSPKREAPTMILFNVVFALRANADPSVISCLHNLSRRIATVLQHEEHRCQYLTREAKLILALQDEVSAVADASEGPRSPFHHILPKCKLARDLKEAYDSLCTSGVVRLHINSWLEVSFCLPHKIHYAASSLIPPEAIERSLKAIRPYHALLLLSDEKSLLSELPVDCSPALVRVIKTTSAVKNLQQLAQDADLALLQVFQLAAHLVYWGKAIIIYPLCESNVYMLSPHASVCLYSPLAEQFSCQFPSHDLPSVLAKFSLPVSLSEFRSPLAPPVQETQLVQMVLWMLQHRLLVQLHTYVCLMAAPSEDDEAPAPARVGGRSLSTPNALSFGSPRRLTGAPSQQRRYDPDQPQCGQLQRRAAPQWGLASEQEGDGEPPGQPVRARAGRHPQRACSPEPRGPPHVCQAPALLPRPPPPGGGHVQREHAALPATRTPGQVPQRAGGDHPRGPCHRRLPGPADMSRAQAGEAAGHGGTSLSHRGPVPVITRPPSRGSRARVGAAVPEQPASCHTLVALPRTPPQSPRPTGAGCRQSILGALAEFSGNKAFICLLAV
ncbi:GATOR complex protein NPRL3 isoform X2 [Tupaia chinensis]|uniref:GATOR complex protein NPRL3 isoform X2 n=1 Tax=Tupaia chinensis TaxID=246437 RepID=UPI000FFB812B|nr:GATOR complex protein NPRL3 isoform X2 [Tupaia chinensis]